MSRRSLIPAINLAAPLNQLGFGVVSTNILRALGARGVDVALWPLGGLDVPREEDREAVRGALARAAFFDSEAPSLRVWHPHEMSQHVGRGIRAGYTFFELTRLTRQEAHHLNSLDVLFVASKWAAEILTDNDVNRPEVVVAPPGVDTTIFNPGRRDLHDPIVKAQKAPTVFFNCGKWEYRKGADVILEAFNKAFETKDNVALVMNCHNPCGSAKNRNSDDIRRYNAEWTRAYRGSKLGSKITVIDQRLPTQKDVADLMAGADCGVFPSRAEGWGMESAEMLAMGKHVILTDYSAHTEYSHAAASLLISVDELEDAYDGHWFLGPNGGDEPGRWARLGVSQVDQLVHHLRTVHRLKQSGQLGSNTAGAEAMRAFTWDATARTIAAELGMPVR